MEEHKTHKVVIYNDDVNSFQYIMACLIRFCKHEPIQAEQCAVIAHNKGRCSVKSGDFLEMFDLKNTFDSLDIKSEIEEYAKSNMH
jgi:ATP-dependent Clp protease adaptor protein ClpS